MSKIETHDDYLDALRYMTCGAFAMPNQCWVPATTCQNGAPDPGDSPTPVDPGEDILKTLDELTKALDAGQYNGPCSGACGSCNAPCCSPGPCDAECEKKDEANAECEKKDEEKKACHGDCNGNCKENRPLKPWADEEKVDDECHCTQLLKGHERGCKFYKESL